MTEIIKKDKKLIENIFQICKEKLRQYKEQELAKEAKIAEHENEVILNENEIHFIRCDGRHFKSFCKGLDKPFDTIFRNTMEKTMIALCEEIQGSVMGFTQSDEITVMFKKLNEESELPFNGRKTKIETSAAASCTLFFNKFFIEEVNKAKEKMRDKYLNDGIISEPEIEDIINKEFKTYDNKFLIATFDARVFSRPNLELAQKIFIWRILDCYKNAVQMVARTKFSNKQLENKKTFEMKEMLLEKGVDIESFEHRNMYGIATIKEEKILNKGTDRECIRKKYILKDSLETVFESDIFKEIS